MNSTPSRKADDVGERTEVIYGFENIVKITLDRLSFTKHTIDSCIDNEIECPRCHGYMELQSSIDKLVYSCENCRF
jgi:hypothetical protein